MISSNINIDMDCKLNLGKKVIAKYFCIKDNRGGRDFPGKFPREINIHLFWTIQNKEEK